MERVCFLLRVRPDRLEEYRARHRSVWPEMRAALAASGWGNYSLFLRDDGLLVGYLETDDFAAPAPRWRRPTSTRAGRPRWPSSSSCRRASGPTPASCAWRRSSTVTDAPAYAAIDLGASSGRVITGRLDDGRLALRGGPPLPEPPGAPARRAALEPAAPVHRGARGRCAAPARCAASASTAGASTTRCSTATTACSGCRSTTATAARRGWTSARSRACPPAELYAVDRHPDDADQHRLPAARRRGLGRAAPAPSGSRSSPTCSRSGSPASSPTSDDRVHHRAARRALAATGRAGSIERLGLPGRLFGDVVEPGTALGPLLRPPRARRRAGVRGRRPRHRLGLRRRAGARRARRDPLERDVVAARRSSCPSRCWATPRARRT